jgi:hypothetical protein
MGVVMERWCPTQQMLGVLLMTTFQVGDRVRHIASGKIATVLHEEMQQRYAKEGCTAVQYFESRLAVAPKTSDLRLVKAFRDFSDEEVQELINFIKSPPPKPKSKPGIEIFTLAYVLFFCSILYPPLMAIGSFVAFVALVATVLGYQRPPRYREFP